MIAKIDFETCIGCGMCEDTCPAVFRIGSNGMSEVYVESIPEGSEQSFKEAVRDCPAYAIIVAQEQLSH